VRPIAFLRETLRMAAGDLTARPLRSILSIASFAIGIAITVVLVAMGDGLHSAVREILKSLGDGQISVTPGRTTGVGGQRRSGRTVRFRYEEIQDIKDQVPSVEGIAAYFDLRGGGASSFRYSIPFSPVRAVDREYLDVRQLPIIDGRWFSALEEEEGRWVAVLNEGVSRIVFPDGGPVGQWIEWRGRRMTVIGVVRDEANFPYIFFIPYRTVSEMADARYISGLIARPAPGRAWERAIRELRVALAGLGGFDIDDRHALEIEDNSAFTGKVSAVTTALHALIITIAGVSLLLGGLGVANMMVIAVTERTREIGLRKALGATPHGIFLQILCESLAIIAAGGALGFLAGALTCTAVGELPMSFTYRADVRFNLEAALVSLAGLAAVGILAGTIPARRAAALPAAEALRWE
jgi:putative ABC transport system permease protein